MFNCYNLIVLDNLLHPLQDDKLNFILMHISTNPIPLKVTASFFNYFITPIINFILSNSQKASWHKHPKIHYDIFHKVDQLV